MVYVHGFKAIRADRWRNLQLCVGDYKEWVIPLRRRIFIV